MRFANLLTNTWRFCVASLNFCSGSENSSNSCLTILAALLKQTFFMVAVGVVDGLAVHKHIILSFSLYMTVTSLEYLSSKPGLGLNNS